MSPVCDMNGIELKVGDWILSHRHIELEEPIEKCIWCIKHLQATRITYSLYPTTKNERFLRVWQPNWHNFCLLRPQYVECLPNQQKERDRVLFLRMLERTTHYAQECALLFDFTKSTGPSLHLPLQS